ncbi:MAG: glutaredoxin family protein [Syntrophaceae bacterium]|nr:glutaredoxin family protein [Syntrophaceae bacterium]
MRQPLRHLMPLCAAILLFVALAAGLSGAATLYRWVDDKGVVHVSENPPEGKVNVAQAVVGEDPAKEPAAGPSTEKREFRVRPGEVTIYTTPTCPWCHRAKAWFRDKRIRYREIDVTTDRQGLDEMVKISGQTGVPVIVVGDEVIVGFNQNRLKEIFRE